MIYTTAHSLRLMNVRCSNASFRVDSPLLIAIFFYQGNLSFSFCRFPKRSIFAKWESYPRVRLTCTARIQQVLPAAPGGGSWQGPPANKCLSVCLVCSLACIAVLLYCCIAVLLYCCIAVLLACLFACLPVCLLVCFFVCFFVCFLFACLWLSFVSSHVRSFVSHSRAWLLECSAARLRIR